MDLSFALWGFCRPSIGLINFSNFIQCRDLPKHCYPLKCLLLRLDIEGRWLALSVSGAVSPVTFLLKNGFFLFHNSIVSLGGEIGRRTGLKILSFLYRGVPVQVRPRAPNLFRSIFCRTFIFCFFSIRFFHGDLGQIQRSNRRDQMQLQIFPKAHHAVACEISRL